LTLSALQRGHCIGDKRLMFVNRERRDLVAGVQSVLHRQGRITLSDQFEKTIKPVKPLVMCRVRHGTPFSSKISQTF